MANKKKIAIIGLKGLPAFGGAASAGEHVIEQLADKYDFTVYSTASHTSHRGLYKGANQIVFKKFPIRSLNVLYYYVRSAWHVVTNKYDLVHLHQMDAAFILLLLRLRYKVVATSHGLTYKTGKWSKLLYPYFKLNEWMQASLSNHLTVVAKSLVSHYAAIVPESKISYIPNGINLSTESAVDRQDGDFILFAAGRIISIKGLHLLLPALRKLNYKGKLIVLGDLDQIKEYKAEILALSDGLDVEYKGLIRDKAKLNSYIAGAKLFVFPSTQEAMSMMLLEVASLKTPIISSDIVENTDIFTESDVRFFKSGSVEDLGEKIQLALADGDEMKKRAMHAYATLEDKYQWVSISKQYDEIYWKVMDPS